MTKDLAIAEALKHQYLIGREFILPDGETENIKAVVAWKEEGGDWQVHVCFYNWNGKQDDDEISHMNLRKFQNMFLLGSGQ